MLTRTGQVMVDPRYPLGMSDFEQLYTGGGRSPAESASMLHMTAPTEAKSYLREQWGKLGMTGFPEDYFSNPANRSAPPTMPAGVPGAGGQQAGPQLYSIGPDGRPVFANEMAKRIAIDTGAYDPTYISPTHQAAARAGEARRLADAAAAAAAVRKATPLTPGLDSEGLARAQMAGDRGDTKRVLQSLQNINADEDILLPPGQRAQVQGYLPTGGIGGSPSEEPMASRLDMNIVNDPEFAKIARQDPSRAAYVYQSLTGRSYDGDVKSFNQVQDRQNKFGMDFASTAIRNGAKFDPVTGKWQLWQRTEPEGGIGSIGAPQGAQTRLVDATPEQQMLMERNYKSVTGFDLPRVNPMAQGIRRNMMEDMNYIDDKQRGAFDDMVARAQSVKGAPLDDKEKRAILDKVLVEMPKGTNSIWWKALETLSGMGDRLRGGAPSIPEQQQAGPQPMRDAAIMNRWFGPGGILAPRPLQ